MTRNEIRRFAGLMLLIGLVTVFTMGGWGHWGMGAYGDYGLDMSDALRVFQGDRPYCDFLSNYSVLILFLLAPCFSLGQSFFPLMWVVFAGFVVLQLSLLQALVRALPVKWMYALIALGISGMAFAPINSKFVMGYSSAGYLATILWTVILFLLWNYRERRAWFLSGIFLGLVPFTKIDLGITAFCVLISFLVFSLKKSRPVVLIFTTGFLTSWLGFILFLLLWGMKLDLLMGSIGESIGQATMVSDEILKFRMTVMFGGGLFLAVGLSLKNLRPVFLKIKRSLDPWFFWILPAALLMDVWRGFPFASLKHMVMLNYLWVIVWILTASHLLAVMFRRRTIRIFRFRNWPVWLLILVVSGVGIFRVSVTGWYPLNYYQPTLLLMTLFWFAAREKSDGTLLRGIKRQVLIAVLVIHLAASYRACTQHQNPVTRFATPYGQVGVLVDPSTAKDLEHILSLLNQAPKDSFILCTYEPSLQLLTGMRSSALYTNFAKLGFTGRYQTERERQSFDFLKTHPPLFVVMENERAVFSKHLGTDYGVEIKNWILANYHLIYESHPDSLIQHRLYRKN